MAVAEFRQLAAAQNPFMLGAYPDRPSPTHVLNGFVAASLGVSPRGNAIADFIATGEVPEELGFLSDWEWTREQASLAALRTDVSLMFNPNRRIWQSFKSPAPVHGLLATRDTSDDRFGPLAWTLVNAHAQVDYVERLRRLFYPEESSDPVTACARIFVSGSETTATRTIEVADHHWFGSEASPAGRVLAKNLTSFVEKLTRPTEDPQRLARIQHLGRGIYLAVILALIFGPIAAAEDAEIQTLDELGHAVVWTGMPPGPQEHPIVMASSRSLQLLIETQRAAIGAVLSRSLDSQGILRTMPKVQRRRAVLRAQMLAGGAATDRVEKALQVLAALDGVSLDGERPGAEWVRRLTDRCYTADFVVRGLRSMGWKVGFIGPDRGRGTPRFLAETPLLGTLVEGLVPEGGMDFEAFVDGAREQLGIVLGIGTRDDLPEELALWESAGVGRRLLKDNQEALRHRLIRAGLAREYSDSHTEVLTNA